MRRRWLERTDGRGGEDSSEDLTSSDDSERGDRSYSDLGIGDLRDEHRDDYEQDDDDERNDGGALPGPAARPLAVQDRADDDEQDEDDATLSGPKARLLAALQHGQREDSDGDDEHGLNDDDFAAQPDLRAARPQAACFVVYREVLISLGPRAPVCAKVVCRAVPA